MQNFKEFLKHRDKELYETLIHESNTWKNLKKGLLAAGVAGSTFLAPQVAPGQILSKFSSKLHAGKNYNEDEIVARTKIIPYDLLVKSSIDPEKFTKDYQSLPQSFDNDIGHGMMPDMFKKPVSVIVVTDEALKKRKSSGKGYAIDDVIVMPKSSFYELPIGNNPGKLTPEGITVLSHELRHTTQTSYVPPERRQTSEKTKWKDIVKYFFDPKEQGVRIAAFKNYNTKNTLLKLIGSEGEDFIKALPDNELERMKLLLQDDEDIIKYMMNKNVEPSYAQQLIERLKNQLKTNYDIKSIYWFLENLKDKEKYNQYIDDMINNYHKVANINQRTQYG